MKRECKNVPATVLAVSLIDKLRQRKNQIEKMQLRNLNPALVKEWKRLKFIEREILG